MAGHFLAYCAHRYDSEHPSESGTESIDEGVAHATEILCAGRVEVDALLHEERCAHDGTVYGDEREEDTQCSVEGRGEALHNHLHQLHDTSDDSNEDNERKITEVNALDETVGTEYLGLKQIVGWYGDAKHECHGDTESE